MKILVCGGRDYGRIWYKTPPELLAQKQEEQAFFRKILDNMYAKTTITTIIEGGATGADALAAKWATDYNITLKTYRAQWRKYAKSAGAIRNQQMLDEEADISMCVAFPGGSGTADMIRRAQTANIPVFQPQMNQVNR